MFERVGGVWVQYRGVQAHLDRVRKSLQLLSQFFTWQLMIPDAANELQHFVYSVVRYGERLDLPDPDI